MPAKMSSQKLLPVWQVSDSLQVSNPQQIRIRNVNNFQFIPVIPQNFPFRFIFFPSLNSDSIPVETFSGTPGILIYDQIEFASALTFNFHMKLLKLFNFRNPYISYIGFLGVGQNRRKLPTPEFRPAS